MWRVAMLIITLLVSPVFVFAERWQSVASGEDGSKWSIDRDSVRNEEPYIHFEAIEEYASTTFSKYLNAYVASLLKSYAADCLRQTFAITAYVARDSSGKTLDTYSSPQSRWKHNEITPDSVAFKLVEFACESAGQSLGQRDVNVITFLTSDMWELVDLRSESETYLDKGVDTRTDQGTMTLSMVVYMEPQAIGGIIYTRVVSYSIYNCVEGTINDIFFWFYNSAGQVVEQGPHDSKPERPRAGSRAAASLSAICSKWSAEQETE